MVINGSKSALQVSKDLDVNSKTLYKEPIENENRRLKMENKLLKQEKEILKKVAAYFGEKLCEVCVYKRKQNEFQYIYNV